MKVNSVIEGLEIVEKILERPEFWAQKARPPSKENGPLMSPEYHIDYMDSRVPLSEIYAMVRPTVSRGLHRLIIEKRELALNFSRRGALSTS